MQSQRDDLKVVVLSDSGTTILESPGGVCPDASLPFPQDPKIRTSVFLMSGHTLGYRTKLIKDWKLLIYLGGCKALDSNNPIYTHTQNPARRNSLISKGCRGKGGKGGGLGFAMCFSRNFSFKSWWFYLFPTSELWFCKGGKRQVTWKFLESSDSWVEHFKIQWLIDGVLPDHSLKTCIHLGMLICFL
jgi:hypothetical protein